MVWEVPGGLLGSRALPSETPPILPLQGMTPISRVPETLQEAPGLQYLAPCMPIPFN